MKNEFDYKVKIVYFDNNIEFINSKFKEYFKNFEII